MHFIICKKITPEYIALAVQQRGAAHKSNMNNLTLEYIVTYQIIFNIFNK